MPPQSIFRGQAPLDENLIYTFGFGSRNGGHQPSASVCRINMMRHGHNSHFLKAEAAPPYSKEVVWVWIGGNFSLFKMLMKAYLFSALEPGGQIKNHYPLKFTFFLNFAVNVSSQKWGFTPSLR